jgi:S-adenosylmethionine synthetase
MFEKVNPAHPDKIADRIAGAIVDAAYKKQKDPKIAVEVLIGHGCCHIIAETSVHLKGKEVRAIVRRIAGAVRVDYKEKKQDENLARNQEHGFRCGDNGIFKGAPITEEQRRLTDTAQDIFGRYGTDGKYILNGESLVICQSHAGEELSKVYPEATINPLGYWTGGINVDAGANNRKLGSDMGDSITGGGLHGKDLSKADVSINIWCFLKAQELGEPVEVCCAIGDIFCGSVSFGEMVETAREYIESLGGFEKFAEWGLIR